MSQFGLALTKGGSTSVTLVAILVPALPTLILLLILVTIPLAFFVTRFNREYNPKQTALRVEQGRQKLPSFLFVYGGLLLAYVLYGSFAPVAQPLLTHLDPVLFFYLQMLCLLPLGVGLIVRWTALLDQSVLVRGALFGSCQAGAVLCFTLALQGTNISQTTVFTCVNGVTAALVAWLVLKQRVRLSTWMACLFAILGALVVAMASPLHWQGNVTAFVGGSLDVVSAFLVELLLVADLRTKPQVFWPIVGVQIVVMTVIAALFAVCEGDWRGVSTLQFNDLGTIGSLAFLVTLLPMILLTRLQQYVSALTLALFAVVDPLVSTGFAFLVGERLPPVGYLGLALVLASLLLQALKGMREEENQRGPSQESSRRGKSALRRLARNCSQ